MQSEKAIEYQNLKSLDLSFKKLHSIPTYVFELSSLEDLNLSHNQLQELPREILKLKSLKNLDISWNHITHNLDFLPTEINVNRKKDIKTYKKISTRKINDKT